MKISIIPGNQSIWEPVQQVWHTVLSNKQHNRETPPRGTGQAQKRCSWSTVHFQVHHRQSQNQTQNQVTKEGLRETSQTEN